MQKIRLKKVGYSKMYQINRFSQEKQRQHAVGRLSSALMEAVDEAQYAAPAGKPFVLLACIRFLLSKTGMILLCGLMCALLTLAFYQIVPLKYEATAKLYILENDGSGVEMSALQKGSLLLSDYCEVLKTWEVHEAVRSQMGLDLSYREMQEMLTVQIPSGSHLMYITVRHQDAAFAAALANAYAQAAYTFIVDSLHGLTPEFFSRAIIPSRTSGLGLTMRSLAAMTVGILAASWGYVIFFCLDDRIRTPEDLAHITGVPVLSSIPLRKSKFMSVEEKEKACLLASSLIARKVRCIMVNAPRSGDGVSFVCSALMQAMAALHCKALWIRVEHKPFWNHTAGKTLGDYLEGRCEWTEIIQPFEGASLLSVCGTEDELPSQLFHPRMAGLMSELQSAYDVVIVDVPPMHQRADAAAFFSCCDGILLTVACGQTRLTDLTAYLSWLDGTCCPLIGAVLNRTGCVEKKGSRHAAAEKAGAAV